METIWTIFGFIAIAAAVFAALRHGFTDYMHKVTVRDYQSGLHYKHGRFLETLGAGKHRFWGGGHEVVVYDTRQAQLVVQGQELITADKASLKVTAVVLYRVVDARVLVESAENGIAVHYTEVQLALRDVIGAEAVDAILENKTAFGDQLVARTRDAAAAKGIALERVEIRDVMLGGDLKRVFAGVIHARKEAEATLEKARGEAAALRTMANASRLLQNNPELLQLKYLQAIGEAGQGTGGRTLVMGLPDWLTAKTLKE